MGGWWVQSNSSTGYPNNLTLTFITRVSAKPSLWNTLSPPQRLPLGIPIKISIIDKNRKRAGDDGKRETAGEPQIWPENRTLYGRGLSSLFPLPIVPRALPFSFSPASPQHKSFPTIQRGLCGGERWNTRIHGIDPVLSVFTWRH